MAEDLVRFLDSISYSGDRDILKDTEIEKVLLHKKEGTYEVILNSLELLPLKVVEQLNDLAEKGIHQKEKCFITYKYQNENENRKDYVMMCLKKYQEEKNEY